MIRSARRALPAGAGRREQHVLHHQVGSSEGEAGEGDAARAGGARPRAVFRRARAPQGRAGKPHPDRATPTRQATPLRRATSAHSSRRPARAQASASIVVSSEPWRTAATVRPSPLRVGSGAHRQGGGAPGAAGERACAKVLAPLPLPPPPPPPPPPRTCRRLLRPALDSEGRRPPRTPDEQAQQKAEAPEWSDLEHRRILGVGTFGRVRLVKHKPTNKAFALKAMRKQQVPSDPSTSSPALLAP